MGLVLGGAYHLLTPVLGLGALALTWALFWLVFGLVDTLLQEGSALSAILALTNADSLPTQPGEAPYRRKIITFKNQLDKSIGQPTVRIDKVRPDMSEFQRRFEPSHPAADAQGYVQAPNVNTLIEMMDMREAQRSYEANLGAIRTSRSMLQTTIDLLRQ